MSQKRIYMTVPRGLYGKGGIERQCQYLLAAWPEAVPDLPMVPLVTRGDRGLACRRFCCLAKVRVLKHRDLGHFIWPWVYLGASLKLLYACAVRRDVGVLHLNAAVRASLWRKVGLALIARAFRVPTVVHLHGGGFDREFDAMGPLGQKLTRWLFRQTDRCIVLGQYWADYIIRTFDVPPERVTIQMNAVPTPRHVHAPDFTARPQQILFLGEVGERKGVHILVAALGQLGDRDDWRCIVAGNGPIEVFRQQAAALGVAERIRFLGWQSPAQTAALLESADILALPSFSENLPMAVLEGLAHGLVVISTPVGAIPEVIADDVSGLLVPVGDAGALAGAFRRALDHPGQARAWSLAAAATFRDRLSLTPYCRNLAAIYRQVMQRHG